MSKRLFPAKKEAKNTLTQLVRALCADYQRRKIHILKRDVSRRVRMEYEYINTRIFEGAGEIAGGALAEKFIYEIGESIGYTSSEITSMGESTYKSYKTEILKNIAKKLHLSD